MACSNCKKLKKELDVARRSATTRAASPEDQDAQNELSSIEQERDKALVALASMISSAAEFAEVSRLLEGGDETIHNRWKSKLSFFERYIEDVMEKANIVRVPLAGQEYHAGLSVEVINLSDFGASDLLEIDEVVRPLLLFKSKTDEAPKLLQTGRVTVRRKESQ